MRSRTLHLFGIPTFLLTIVIFGIPAAPQEQLPVKPGTKIELRLLTVINARLMKTGDIIDLETVWPISVPQHDIPARAKALGRVVRVSVPSNDKGDATLSIVIEKIFAKDVELKLNAYPIEFAEPDWYARSSGQARSLPSGPQSEVTVSKNGPPPISTVTERPVSKRPPTSLGPEQQRNLGAPTVPLYEPLPVIKRLKQPPSTVLRNRGNVLVSAETKMIVQEFVR